MDRRHIVPVEPASGDGDVVVVQVQQKGSHPLDVRLVGCEGESPYVTQIKHVNIGKLKNKFKGSDEEWEAILSRFLLQKLPGDQKLLENIHLVYTLKNDAIELSIRQHVKGIKVTLGEISLTKDEEWEIDPLEWSRVSAQNHVRTLQELANLKSSATNEQATITKLKTQLEDFIKTKDETEKEMLQQFMQLINEKKRKIRDQSRLLAGAKVSETEATIVKSTREAKKPQPRTAAASRASKRKATPKAPEPEPEAEAEAQIDADQMEVDEVKEEEQDEDSGPGAATPDRGSDEETEDEDEPPRVTPVSKDVTEKEDDETIPARRELPFGRPATRRKQPAPKPAPPAADDETEDEEEL